LTRKNRRNRHQFYLPDLLADRNFGEGQGLRIMNLDTHAVRVLTTGRDNMPDWSPTSDRIIFTRKQDDNFDIFSIKSDGTDLQRLTTFPASDAHAVWSGDGKHIMWSSGQYGFKDEAAL
jgi:Tol biopolymer transport system component